MDVPKHSAAFDPGRGRKMGVMGGCPCASCGMIVGWRVQKFCLDQRARFGGRIYCLRCQMAIPRAG